MSRMKYFLLVFVIGLGSISSNAGVASTSVIKVGASCLKRGSVKVVGDSKYICTAKGKKTVWRFIPVAKSTSPSNPDLSVMGPSKSTPEKPEFVAPTIPTNFDDLSSHLSGIIYGSWLKASEKIKSQQIAIDNIKFIQGPNTALNKTDSNYRSAIDKISSLYSNLPQSKNVYVIYYGESDIAWAQSQFESYMDTNYGYGNRATVAADNCSTSQCNGGITVHTKNFDSIILMADSNGWKNSHSQLNQGYLGHVFAHEYTHTIQMANMNPNWGNFPRWLTEGVAEWSATIAVTKDSFDEYVSFRSEQDLKMQYESPEKYDEKFILDFLNPDQNFKSGEDIGSYPSKYHHWDAYSIGMMVSEILVNIKDQDSLIKVLQNISRGMTFAQSFKNEYGVNWEIAAPKIAHAIAEEIRLNIKK